ncbi:anti-sigma F factor antagonist [Desulfolucanica intricata]|uniref:anti-sigma F factor antagonist n=1 Tax=Desulfolucanica intricata TaxID=1285191 RepID=UPI0008361224|nr:anti-sigma F factor antagonist [Desulfolucanica intricata]
MLIDLEVKEDILLVRLGGELDLRVVNYLRDTLEDALSNNPVKNVILNMNSVSFIDSSALGVILGRYKKVNQNGGKMGLVGIHPQVKRILELSGLLRIMKEYTSEQEALAKIG